MFTTLIQNILNRFHKFKKRSSIYTCILLENGDIFSDKEEKVNAIEYQAKDPDKSLKVFI